MDFTDDHRDTLRDILSWRRDVRHFLRDPLPEDMLTRLSHTLDYAPSVGNARPWRVIRVRDADLRRAVVENFEQCNTEALADYAPDRQADYARLKLAGLREAPEHFAVFTAIDPAEGHGLGRRTIPETLRQSTAMAIHTLWLAARAENIGLGMVSILDPRAVERIFAVPPDWEFSAYLCLGYPVFTDQMPLLHRVGWQENRKTVWEER